jgi:prephenate dehydrogenase
MKIFIVGLGLIGASYAEGLKLKGHEIYGYDKDLDTLNKAKELEVIHKESMLKDINKVDLVILALYPQENVKFIKDHYNLFVKNQVITDVAGTKTHMIEEIINLLPDGISYTSHHPMAGRESSGFLNRDYKIFNKANFIIVKTPKSKEIDFQILEIIKNDLNFGKMTVVDAKTHDELIAFTSQLTHILAVSLIQSDHLEETKKATGDSFRDLTRIAKINEEMWTELFLENKKVLIDKITDFQLELELVKDLIQKEQKNELKKYLKEAKEKRKSFDIH